MEGNSDMITKHTTQRKMTLTMVGITFYTVKVKIILAFELLSGMNLSELYFSMDLSVN